MAGGFEIDVVARPADRALDVFVWDDRGHYITFDGHSPDFAALTSPVRRPAVTIGAGLGPRIADVLRAVAARLDALAVPPPAERADSAATVTAVVATCATLGALAQGGTPAPAPTPLPAG